MTKNPKVVIQNIQPEDIDEIIEFGLNTPELHIDKDPEYYSKEMLNSFIQSHDDIHLCAKVEGKLAGYRLATYNKYLKEAYLIDMVVSPEFRGQGIASALYEKTFEILNNNGCEWAWVLTKENNERIQKILEKKGFNRGLSFRLYYKVAPF